MVGTATLVCTAGSSWPLRAMMLRGARWAAGHFWRSACRMMRASSPCLSASSTALCGHHPLLCSTEGDGV